MIEVEHISKYYAGTAAVEDVSFKVESGEIMGFLGPNGAGKTTTMRILTGYLPATGGTAKVAGYDVHQQSMAVRRRIGYLPENPPLYPDMTVEEYLWFVSRIKGVAAGDRASRVNLAMRRCQIYDRRRMMIAKLSKGYRQRVGIAGAIVHDPPVIILDEPTIGLDPKQIIEVRNLIKSLAGEHTIILSTHILPEVSMTCDRITIISKGKVVAINTPTNLMEQLGESSGYELEIGGDVEKIKSQLEKVTGVKRVIVKAMGNVNSPRSTITVATAAGTEPGKDIAVTIVNQGLDLYEMRRSRASLEDVFLELTTEEFTVSSVS